jgi:hypothetical protein
LSTEVQELLAAAATSLAGQWMVAGETVLLLLFKSPRYFDTALPIARQTD